MASVSLNKILLKGEELSLLRGLIATLTTPIVIQDHQGKILVTDLGIEFSKEQDQRIEHIHDDISCEKPKQKVPIVLDTEILGWVVGNEQVQQVANFINYLAKREFERKTLTADTLDKYREISLLYTIAKKMSNCLDIEEIGTLLIEEASRLIESTSASVMLYNKQSSYLEIVSAKGSAQDNRLKILPNQGIAGNVFVTGNPELINDVMKDPRYINSKYEQYALICVPIVTKDRILGVVNISNSQVFNYTSKDLKLFTALVTQASGAIENALLHESKLREEKIKNNLERYLSPQVAKAVIDSAEEISLTTSKRRIAMLFSDIRNFTTKCEELEPEKLVSYLNEYFTQMVDVIFNHQGTVNKFVGDMIVAMFGAPSAIADREYWAIAAAINMQKRIKELPIEWIRQNFITGIGISSGDVIVGNIGSPQHMDYTAIGDEMNIASRLQGLAQGGQILVTRSVYEATQTNFQFREFGTLPVKGKKNLVEIFEVIYE
jgi:adenylate cyclase